MKTPTIVFLLTLSLSLTFAQNATNPAQIQTLKLNQPLEQQIKTLQGQLEKDGALRQRKLGALGTVDNAGGSAESEEEDEPEEKPAKEKE